MFSRCANALTHPFHTWTDYVGILALLSIAGVTFVDYDADDPRRWLVLAIMFAFGYGVWWLRLGQVPWKQHLRVAILALLTTSLVFLDATGFTIVIMFFILSSGVMEMMPARHGYLWIIAFGVLTLLVYLTAWIGYGGILNAVGTFAGYMFFGSMSDSALRATEAKAESQRLLRELQEAHNQLRERSAQAEELAASEERNRLAREVHDTLGHRLTVAAVQLEGAEKLIEADPHKARSMVTTVRKQVIEGLGELRHTVAALRAPLEQDISLPNALRKLTTGFEEATNIATELRMIDELPRLPDGHRHAIYRATQESLTNIQRHAQATRATVQLEQQNNAIVLSVRDNGIGIDGIGIDPKTEEHGFGLHGLEERASQLGGQVKVTSHNNGGTQLTLRLPAPDARFPVS